MDNKSIRLSESQLEEIIHNSVKTIVNESLNDYYQECINTIDNYRKMLDSGEMKSLNLQQKQEMEQFIEFLERYKSLGNTGQWIKLANAMQTNQYGKYNKGIRDSKIDNSVKKTLRRFIDNK